MRNTENSNIKLDHVSAVQCHFCAHPTPCATDDEASPLAVPQAEKNKSCRLALSTSYLVSHLQLIVVSLDQCTCPLLKICGICDERFAAVIPKKRDNNLEIHKSRPAVVSGQDSSRTSVISKKLNLISMITTRISPHISASGSEILYMDI